MVHDPNPACVMAVKKWTFVMDSSVCVWHEQQTFIVKTVWLKWLFWFDNSLIILNI